MSKTDKSVWMSGETCDIAAVYFANTCDHPIKKDYRKYDIFVRCPTCNQALRWTRMKPSDGETDGPRKFA